MVLIYNGVSTSSLTPNPNEKPAGGGEEAGQDTRSPSSLKEDERRKEVVQNELLCTIVLYGVLCVFLETNIRSLFSQQSSNLADPLPLHKITTNLADKDKFSSR